MSAISTLYATAPHEDQDISNGISQALAQISGSVRLAIASLFITSAEPEKLLHQYRSSFYTGMAFAGVGTLTALTFVKPEARKESGTADNIGDRAISMYRGHNSNSDALKGAGREVVAAV